MARPAKRSMSPLEDTVMRVIWARGPCTADEVRQALSRKQPMKDSTARTVLRRLEEKGYLTHEVSGRTYVYRERVPARKAAMVSCTSAREEVSPTNATKSPVLG